MNVSKLISSLGFLGVALMAPQLAGCASDTDETAFVGSEASAISSKQAERIQLVVDWAENAWTVDTSAIQVRTAAVTQLAIFDVLNAFDREFEPYLFTGLAPAGADKQAAVIQAAHDVISAFRPPTSPVGDISAFLAGKRAADLSSIKNGPGKDAGIAFGAQVAAAYVAERCGSVPCVAGTPASPTPADGWNANPVPGGYVSPGAPDSYTPTVPGPPQPVIQRAGTFRPFSLTSPTQFHVAPPPALSDPDFVAQVNETMAKGSSTSADPTGDNAALARYYAETGTASVSRLGRELALKLNNQNKAARFLALLQLAVADDVISVFTSKYIYKRIRPVTLIRRDYAAPTWTPRLTTPPHPEYPAAHGSLDATAAKVVEAFFGENYAFTFTSGAPMASRAWSSFAEYDAAGNEARIYAGAHFRSANDAGHGQGVQVAAYVLANELRPLGE